jgi:hypothetical protein
MPIPPERDVLDFVIKKFKELTVDLDVGEIAGPTLLKTLGLRSIILVYALAEIQDHFQLHDELLATFLADGVPLDEHSIGELAGCVVTSLGAP